MELLQQINETNKIAKKIKAKIVSETNGIATKKINNYQSKSNVKNIMKLILKSDKFVCHFAFHFYKDFFFPPQISACRKSFPNSDCKLDTKYLYIGVVAKSQ